MPHNKNRYTYPAIVLILSLFWAGVGSGVSLCFMPDGEIHVEEDHLSCSLSETLASVTGQVEGQRHCLDVSLNEVTSHHHRHVTQLQAPALVFLWPPSILTPVRQKTSPNIPLVVRPQLQSLQSVVLLI